MKNPGAVALIETVAGKEPVEPKSGKLPAGYCTLDFLEKQLKIVFERVLETRVNAEKSQSVGVLVIYNKKLMRGLTKFAKNSWNWPKNWNQDIHKTLDFSNKLFHLPRFNEK